jgi:hypothetical protein
MVARLAMNFERYCDHVPSSRIIRYFLRVDAGEAEWSDWASGPEDWYVEVLSQPSWADLSQHLKSWDDLLNEILARIMVPFVQCYETGDVSALLRVANCYNVLPEEVGRAVARRLDDSDFDWSFREVCLKAIFAKEEPSDVWSKAEALLMPKLEAASTWIQELRQSWSHELDRAYETIRNPAIVLDGTPGEHELFLSGPVDGLLKIRLRWFTEPDRQLVLDAGGGRFRHELAQFSELAFSRALGRSHQGVRVGLELLQSIIDAPSSQETFQPQLVFQQLEDHRLERIAQFLGVVADGVRSDRPLAENPKSGRKLRGTFRGRLLMASALLRDLSPSLASASQMMLIAAALECLVGSGKERVTDTVATHAAFLLEPNPEWRKYAVSLLKSLYGYRSAVTHGAQDVVPREAISQMRTVLGACMISIMDRIDYATNRGLPAAEVASEDLWDQYRQYALTGRFDLSAAGLMAGHGVPIRRVRRLWCADQGIDLRGEFDLFDSSEIN